MRTQVGNLLVSTIYLNPSFQGPHYETMVFKCDAKGKVTDWLEQLYASKTFNMENADAHHQAGIAFAQSHSEVPASSQT